MKTPLGLPAAAGCAPLALALALAPIPAGCAPRPAVEAEAEAPAPPPDPSRSRLAFGQEVMVVRYERFPGHPLQLMYDYPGDPPCYETHEIAEGDRATVIADGRPGVEGPDAPDRLVKVRMRDGRSAGVTEGVYRGNLRPLPAPR
jgi:hypothetical protein